MKTIQLTINGRAYTFEVEFSSTLLEVLRNQANLTGTKRGCDSGHCGACTVLLNNKPVNSCCVLAVEADGADVVTIEGESQNNQPSKLQQAFIDANAVQCGFCTPGMIMSARHLLNNNKQPTDAEIDTALSGNLCRCTGYVNIRRAVHLAAAYEAAASKEESNAEG